MCVCLGWQDPPFLREEGSYTGKKEEEEEEEEATRKRKKTGKKEELLFTDFFPSLFSFPFISIPRPSLPPLKEEEEGQWFSSHLFGENCLAFVSFIFEGD